MQAREPTELHAVVDGDFACSHPGQFAVASVSVGDGHHVTVISLYGIWDRMIDSRNMYPEATLHRAISDLTVIFEERGAHHVLVARDLNIYTYSDGSIRSSRAQTVLARLAAYRLELCGPPPPHQLLGRSRPRLARPQRPPADFRPLRPLAPSSTGVPAAVLVEP